MALSDDQKALLRLLAQREQGYDDIAALMGLSVEEVRARVKDALDAVEREQEDEPTLPPTEPQAPEEAKPKPQAPPAPEPPAKPQAPPPPPTGKPKGRALPKERRIYAIAAGLAAIAIVIVLLATGVLGGSDSDSGSAKTSSSTASSEAVNPSSADTIAELTNSDKLTGAVLKPVDGSDAEGAAVFGRAKKQVLLQIEASGLDPSPKGSSYTIWLYKSPKLALRIGAVAVDDSGGIKVQLPIPAQLLAYVASGVFDQIDIALTSDSEYEAEVAKAKKEKGLPPYTGTDVLRGQIEGPLTKAPAKAGN